MLDTKSKLDRVLGALENIKRNGRGVKPTQPVTIPIPIPPTRTQRLRTVPYVRTIVET